MQNKGLLIGLGVLVAIVVVAFLAYSGSNKPNYGQTTASPVAIPVGGEASPSGETGQAKEIKVSASEYSFTPGTISLTAGEKVKIVFTNTGRLPHNLTIDELNFATDTIPSGKTTSAEFTATKTGSFTMYCSVGNHRSLGMEGEVGVK